MNRDIRPETNLKRLLGALRLSESDLTPQQLRTMAWLAESEWQTIDNLEAIFQTATKKH